jgi:endoglucanase
LTHRIVRRATAVLAAATAVVLCAGAAPSTAAPSDLAPGTRFYVPSPPPGAQRQINKLKAGGDPQDAALVRAEVHTPQAVWFTSGTSGQVRSAVARTVSRAAATKSVPTLVAYDAPGRDCSQYSSGGAGSDAAYRTWATGFAAGLGRSHTAIVIVEPDGLANLPSDCPTAYPGQDVAALTAGRIADIKFLGEVVMATNPHALVYLDAGHSAWHSVADITSRLEKAGLTEFRGFSLDVSNYQWSPNLKQYGTWVSECAALHPDAATTLPTDCGDQYYSAGPANGNVGVALDPTLQWSDTAAAPTANTAGINSRYAAELGTTRPSAHFVLDTSRNGRGPWTPPAGKYTGDAQPWCNPPGRGLGARPQADPDPATPMLDANLWIKTPGQSDGQCNRSVTGSTTDPEWGNITDPAAGAWFPQQALELARLAVPPLNPATSRQ